MPQSKQYQGKRGLERRTLTFQPVLCGVCGERIDAPDRETAELARMRHYRTVHGIRECEPDYYEQ